MRWVKNEEGTPKQEGYYHVKRNQSTVKAVHFWYDKTGWSSNCDEWLDESIEPDQGILWQELDQIIFNESGGMRTMPNYIIDLFKEKFILTRKQTTI